MKNKQKGIAHPILIGIMVLVVAAVGFTAYRVGKSNSGTVTNSTDASQSDTVNEIKVDKEESEPVKIPEEEKKTEPAPIKTDKPVEQAPDKKDKTYLTIKYVSAEQDGSTLAVHSKIEKAVSGTCNFKLYREGFEKVHSSKKITNSQDCKGTLDISNMPNYSGWSLHVWFDGSDGKTYAYQDAKSLSLTDPN